MEWLGMKQWSPYVAGIGIGMLSWLTFVLSDKPIGCSMAFARFSGMIERVFRGEKTLAKPYFKRYVPEITWDVMLVIGIVIGSFASALLSEQFQLTWVPSLWAATFGSAYFPRLLVAVIGGVLMGAGARWADGCTSGHGISGTLQLAVSSWLAVACFFAGGIVAAFVIFRVLGA